MSQDQLAARLLEQDDIQIIEHVYQWIIDKLPHRLSNELDEYLELVFTEQRNKTLHTHIREGWVNWHSVRHGALSVMGTLCEFVTAAWCYVTYNALFRFEHRRIEQILYNIDGYVALEGIDYIVSIKKNTLNHPTFGGMRLGLDYFPRDSRATLLAFGELSDNGAPISWALDMKQGFEYFENNKNTKNHNHYCYRPLSDVEKYVKVFK